MIYHGYIQLGTQLLPAEIDIETPPSITASNVRIETDGRYMQWKCDLSGTLIAENVIESTLAPVIENPAQLLGEVIADG